MKDKKLLCLFILLAIALFSIFALVACGKINTIITITFVTDNINYSIVKTDDDSITLPDNPTKIGYEFSGWYLDQDTWKIPFDETSNITAFNTSEIKLYAKFNIVNYSITYYNTKNAQNDNPTSYNIESSTINLLSLTASGFTFEGWYNDNNEKVSYIEEGSIGNITLNAKWSVNSEEDDDNTDGNPEDNTNPDENNPDDGDTSDGEDGNNPDSGDDTSDGDDNNFEDNDNTGNIDTKVTLIYDNIENATNPNPDSYNSAESSLNLKDASKVGYEFIGWFDGETKITEIPKGSSGTMTLTAKWSIINYDIVYIDSKNALDNNNSTSYNIESGEIVLQDLYLKGYKFDGWYCGDTRVFTIKSGSTGNLTLTAKWSLINYNINYENIDGITNANNNPVTYNIESNITLNPVEKVGYTFIGWYNGDNEVTSISIGSTGNITLTAKFELNEYSIEYRTNGGSYIPDSNTYSVENLISFKTPTKDGYLFGGWYLEENFITCVTSTKGLTGDIILYAKWEYLSSISFVSNGGSKVQNISQPAGTVCYAPEDPVREHYSFVGWFSDKELTKEYVFSVMPENNITLYAKWTPIEYKINYHLDGGVNGDNPETYTIESSFVLNSASKAGYKFDGWYLDNKFTESIEVIENMSGELNLYAKFTETYYELGEINYDKTKTVVKECEEITAETFSATCLDSNNTSVGIAVTVIGNQIGGQTISVTLTATSLGKTKVATINNIKVYASPTIILDNSAEDMEIEIGTNVESLFTAVDSFGEYLNVEVNCDELVIGTSVIVSVSASDAAGNTIYEEYTFEVVKKPAVYPEGYITISTASDLTKLAENPSANYILTCDIDMNRIIWSAIDNFSGILDGNGYAIKNLTISGAGEYAGFVAINSGTIKNLELENVKLTYSCAEENDFYIGTLAAINKGSIMNSLVSGNLVLDYEWKKTSSSSDYIGGFVGINYGYINNSYSNIVFSGTYDSLGGTQYFKFGGFTAYDESEKGISNCFVTGVFNIDVSVKFKKVGVFIGYKSLTFKITNCYNDINFSISISNYTGTDIISDSLENIKNTIGWDENIWVYQEENLLLPKLIDDIYNNSL